MKNTASLAEANRLISYARAAREEKRKASSSRWSLVFVSMLCVSAFGLRA